MEKQKKQVSTQGIIPAIVMLALGITVLVSPEESASILIFILAALAALAGIVYTVMFFLKKQRIGIIEGKGLAAGLTLVAVGAVLMLNPSVLTVALPLVFGLLLVFSGFSSLQTTYEMLRAKERAWYVSLIFCVLILVAGFLVIFNPFAAERVLMLFLGVALAVDGFMTLFSALVFRKKGNADDKGENDSGSDRM